MYGSFRLPKVFLGSIPLLLQAPDTMESQRRKDRSRSQKIFLFFRPDSFLIGGNRRAGRNFWVVGAEVQYFSRDYSQRCLDKEIWLLYRHHIRLLSLWGRVLWLHQIRGGPYLLVKLADRHVQKDGIHSKSGKNRVKNVNGRLFLTYLIH